MMNTTTQKYFRTLDMTIGIIAVAITLATLGLATKPAMAQDREIPGYIQMHFNHVIIDNGVEGDVTAGRKMDLNTITAMLGHRNHRVASAAAYSLGEIRDAKAVPALIAALKSDCRHMRRIAAHALGKIGDQRAVKPLIDALGNETQSMAAQAAIITSLGKIGDPEARRILSRLNRSPRNWLQQTKDAALLKINTKQSFKVAAAE